MLEQFKTFFDMYITVDFKLYIITLSRLKKVSLKKSSILQVIPYSINKYECMYWSKKDDYFGLQILPFFMLI